MKVWIFSLASVFVVSLISLVGVVAISLNVERLKKILLILVSFAVGGLFGDAFIHLLPEAFEKTGSNILVSLLTIGGVLAFFILEKFIYWRHCHVPTSEAHPHPVVFMNLVGDGLHNLLDGIVIAASYAVSIPIGLATTVAVVLHEIPQEMGDFGILIHGGLTRRKAVIWNFLSASLSILGCLVAFTIGRYVKNFSLYVLPLTAGGFIYMAGSDLMPELTKETDTAKSVKQFLALLLGIFIMALLTVLE